MRLYFSSASSTAAVASPVRGEKKGERSALPGFCGREREGPSESFLETGCEYIGLFSHCLGEGGGGGEGWTHRMMRI